MQNVPEVTIRRLSRSFKIMGWSRLMLGWKGNKTATVKRSSKNVLADLLSAETLCFCWSASAKMPAGRPAGQEDGRVGWWMTRFLGCVSKSAVMYYGMFISSCPCLFFTGSSVGPQSRTVIISSSWDTALGVCMQRNQLPPHHNHTIKLSLSHCQTTKCHKIKKIYMSETTFMCQHGSRIPQRSSLCCTSPFISLKAYSCWKIRTTLRYSVTFVFIWEYVCVYMPHMNTHT